ncbi:MAG: HAMP domain-containing sensor histidine kinase [Anaerolineales bacterium]
MSSSGLALLCDIHGNLLEILHDPQGLAAGLQPGTPFARLAARGSLGKALSFLAEIRAQGAAFDWEINVQAGEKICTLHFSGGKSGETLLIAGAEDGRFSVALYEEMMRMNNEQTNSLRAAYKDAARDASLFDEISRLNNELVDMQRELARQKAELERLNAEKNRYLGMAAHDLRNPLHAILMNSEFLLEECPAGEMREFIATIHETTRFMAQLVDDLLNVAQIEAGELTLDYAPVDLADLIRRNAATNRPLASRKGIELVYHIPEDLPRAVLDAAKFEQVLNNLIGNAVKFSPPGEKVEIRLEARGETFVLCVRDRGPGIPPERMATLFRPFQRGETGSAGEKSIGLGLSIVKRIVAGHGGQIWVESHPGEGAAFYVQFPFRPTT